MKQIAIAAASFLIVGAVVLAQTGQTRSTDNDWPMFSRDFGGTRFSPLADINADNAGKLAQAWSVQLTQPAGRRGGAAAGEPTGRRRRDAALAAVAAPAARRRRRRRRRRGRQQSRSHADRRQRRDVSAGARQPGAGARRRYRQGNLALPDAADGHDHRPRRGVLARRSGHPAAHHLDGRTEAAGARRRDRRSPRRASAATA